MGSRPKSGGVAEWCPPQNVVHILNPEPSSRTFCGNKGFAGGIRERPRWVTRWALHPVTCILTTQDEKAPRGHVTAEAEVPGCDHESRDEPLALTQGRGKAHRG